MSTSGPMNQRFTGIAAAKGMAAAPCALFLERELSYPRTQCQDPGAELARLGSALNRSEEELIVIKEKLVMEGANEEAEVFEAHIQILQDISLKEQVEEAVQQGVNVEAAWMDGIGYFADLIAALPDPTLAARTADVRDVGRRVLAHLLGKELDTGLSLESPAIIVARDLAPSQTAGLDRTMVRGFCTAEGGPTSHTAILAKSLGIPAIVGLGRGVLDIRPSTLLLVDAFSGELIVDPDEKTIAEFQERQNEVDGIAARELEEANQPAITQDGVEISVLANVGSLEDSLAAMRQGAEGIGLLRTEFLYLDRQQAPDEEEQLRSYTAILEVMEERPVVLRTLDIGGDKEVRYLHFGQEINPFLGYRAIRLCLGRPDLFKTQLRAVLRASPGHSLRIMFPMIATLQEIRAAKRIFSEASEEVASSGYSIGEQIQLGMMVEIPAAVILADQFAKEVDFFSIGTNDLTQYSMAADRGNDRVAYLGDACHPAVLRQIKRVIEEGHQAGIWVGLCGELAGDSQGIPLLLGLGLDEWSVAPSLIPHTKAVIRQWKIQDAKKLAEAALDLESAEQVRNLVVNYSSKE